MKPPRLPVGHLHARALAPDPVSITDLLNRSPWAGPTAGGQSSLISWRTVLALLLKQVPIEPVAATLWPTMQLMAEQVAARLEDECAGATAGCVSYGRWLGLWVEQFAHWNDPIRMIVHTQCSGGDAAQLAGHFTALDGLAFADFVLGAVQAFDDCCIWKARMMNEALPSLALPEAMHHSPQRTAMDRAIDVLHPAFRERVAFATGPTPVSHSLAPFLDDIYAQRTLRTGAAIMIQGADQ